ncbi:hypothetical protein PHMEG_0002885 [Phytophthora megakarya]|uniref:CEP76/DRC7 peptidase-like domain-containing protein n=1 Tax=Phytophthora megakarya TaxID=4795 RepID=A0A225WY06_9STRA|nr:hypothetical protein PHMEG_0002885 [Phytophthora megakarya]
MKKQKKSRKELQSTSPQDDSSDEDIETRPKQHSEAKMRDDVEKQRKRHQDSADRGDRSNNRFLRALSGQISNRDQGGDDSDQDDVETTARLLKENIAPMKSTKEIIVTPAASYSSWFQRRQTNLPAAKRWSEQLKLQEAAGLFVDEEKKQFGLLERSTLNRLEERLYRELSASSQQRKDATTAGTMPQPQSRGLLMEELLLPVSHNEVSILDSSLAIDEAMKDTATSQVANMSTSNYDKQKKAPSLAMLELFVDRVVLDDHPTFALVDRLGAQLRALYTAYSRLQQLQPWQLSLQRLDEVFYRSTLKLAEAAPNNLTTIDLSSDQVIQQVSQLLTELETLGQLHQQILGKVNEMRDAGTREQSLISLRVKQRQRTQPIDLSRVDAVLEFMESGIGNQQDERGYDGDTISTTIKTLSERLSAVSTASFQARQTVLQLESITSEVHPSELSFWCPRFYVVIRVNGKIACTTKRQYWSCGVVRFCEKLCFTLPFFPGSVCAEIYEHRRLLRDELLSTNAVPVVVPGQNVAKPAPSSAHSSLFDGWGNNDADHLVPAASLTPSDEWYQFSSTTLIARSQWHRSFQNAPLFVHTSRHTQGRLHLRASWISDMSQVSHRNFGTSYLPPRRPESAGGHQSSPSPVQLVGKASTHDTTQLSQYLCDSGFSNERDFLRLIEPQQLHLDPNDPENVSVRRLQVYYMQQQQEAKAVGLGRRKVFRTSDIPGPLDGCGRGLTKRNRLLRLRDREYASRHGTSFCEAVASHDSGKVEPPRWIPQHAVFDEPLPLLEHELLADERLLRLIRPELYAFDRRLVSEEAERADASIVERHRVRQLLKLQDFRERVRQTQIVTKYNIDNSKQDARAHSKPLAAIVQEKPLPLFPGTLELPAIGALFAPRRRLRPRSKVPTTAPPSQTAAHWPTSCTMYVQVHKATNVPVRIKPPRNAVEAEEVATTGKRRRDTLHRTNKSPRTRTMTSDNQSEEVETPREGAKLEYESHVFVQITFQGKTRKTSCAAVTGTVTKGDHTGAHPMWMETLGFPYRPPQDDWSPEGIGSTQDIIRFSLFDQVTRSTGIVDEDRLEGEERLGAQTRALHRENCFLGSLEVPFLTLYHTGRLEDTLRCEMPVEHLGYANLQVGAPHGATSSMAKTSTNPASAVSSDGDDSPRRSRSRSLSFRSPGRKQTWSHPSSPEASGIDGLDDDDDEDGLCVKQSAREATFLKLTLLLDPVLPVTNPASHHHEKDAWSSGGNVQDKLLLAHAQRWSTSVKHATPAKAERRRNYNVFVRNLSHGATFLPRFLRAQSPPVELQSASLQTLVRFVSLIPFLDDWLAFDGEKDVWSTTQEFLNMGAGDHEEHAVLLANYFMWYDRRHRQKGGQPSPRSYLVLGHAVPEGNIVYVFRRGVLWNASTGIGYATSDYQCPLRDVSLVVSSKNVFANVQPLTIASGAPIGSTHELNWDIESNSKCWKPFFTAKNISLPPSVQRRELTYNWTPSEFVEQVERELREALKLAVRRWRSAHFATIFNEAASIQLREHLKVLEREANGRNNNQDVPASPRTGDNDTQLSPRSTKTLKQKLKMKLALPTRRVQPGSTVLRELQRSREVCGLPLHMSFTDIARVLEIVENTVRGVGCQYDTVFFLREAQPDQLILFLAVGRTSTTTSDQELSSH